MKILESLPAVALAAVMAMAQEPPAGAPPAAAPAPARQRVVPPARIVDFKAEPASIQPGQSVTITWATENPMGATIDPALGRVTPRGARQVFPPRTTTYTLTVRGPNNQVLTQSATVNVAGTTPLAANAATTDVAKQEVPRTTNGKPDLTGVYDFGGGGGGGGRGGRGGRGAAAAEGPALKPDAEKYRVVRGPNDTGATSDCMPLAGPNAFGVPYQFQLVESPHFMAILYGYPGTFRSIPTDGGPHSPNPDPTWMGESIGHWDGDTLVVDTVGFNDKTEINGYHHTEALHTVEKFSRPDFNTLHYEATIEDPNVFVKPWTLSRNYPLRTDLAKVDEFVCEHNPDYSKLFDSK
jgi:hypothetical protein